MTNIYRFMLAFSAAVVLITGPNVTLGQQIGDAAKGRDVEVQELLTVLQSADTSMNEKAIACKMLAIVGDKSAVPALASLLADEKFSHYARYGLEPIPDPSVDQALRDALGKVQGRLLIGVINSIGQRQKEESIDALAGLLADSDPDVVAAAAAALGRIATPATARILNKALGSVIATVRPAVADSCLMCAELLAGKGEADASAKLFDVVRTAKVPVHLRVAATRGLILVKGDKGLEFLAEQLSASEVQMVEVALRAAREIGSDDEVGAVLIAELPDLPEDRKAVVLLALGDLGADAALPALIEAAKVGASANRAAAIRALHAMEATSAADALLEAALSDDEAVSQAALEALGALGGESVDQAIVARLISGEVDDRPMLLALAGTRRIRSIVPLLLKQLQSDDLEERLTAITALGETLDEESLPALTSRLLELEDGQEFDTVRAAIEAACLRAAEREGYAKEIALRIASATKDRKRELLRLLNQLGGADALDAVASLASGAVSENQDVATEVLGEWKTSDAAPLLLGLADTLRDGRFRSRAIKGYIRIVRQFEDLPDGQRLDMARRAMQRCDSAKDKELVLEAIARISAVEALAELGGYLDDAALRAKAAQQAMILAPKLGRQYSEQVSSTLKEIIDASISRNTTSKAQQLLEQVGN